MTDKASNAKSQMTTDHVHERHGPEAWRALEAEARIPTTQWEAEVARGLELGLPGAASIVDKRIPTFSRGELPHYAGINTFLKAPYCEDVRRCGDFDVAVLGAPHDSGTTYRPGTRFGPQGMRKIRAFTVLILSNSVSTCGSQSQFVTSGTFSLFPATSKRLSTRFPRPSPTCTRPAPYRWSWAGTTRSATRPSGGWPSTLMATSG